MNDRPSFLFRIAHALWTLVDGSRRLAMNVLFLAAVAFLLALAIAAWRERARVPHGVALVLKPRGVIVEQLSVEPANELVRELTGTQLAGETLLRDLLDALRIARWDRRIKALVLDLDGLQGGGLSKLRDLREAIIDLKNSGRPVVAYADHYVQGPYYLAAAADEVYLHPQGLVAIWGYGSYRAHYKEGLDRYGIEMHVFRVGEYKSAMEPYLRDDMSEETKESLLDVYGDLWRGWLADVAASRKTTPEAIQAFVDGMPERMRASGGDAAKAAKEAGLVDVLAPRDQLRQHLITLVGEDKATKSFRQVGMREYLAARSADRVGRKTGPAVAVVVAKGTVLDGTQPPGTIGSESTGALIRRARQDDGTKALVLRVDSPGGSAFASEVIRRELELTREAGKPVVVSMGSVAASGGYWIATASDEIWASPATITGSIGVYGAFATIQKPLATYLGVHVDGVGTTRLTGALRPDRPLDPAVAEMLQSWIDHNYEEFLARVGAARKKSRDETDRLARGRIWSGEDAKTNGLVDHLGGLPQAIESAARRAKLGEAYRVVYLEKTPTLRERLLMSLTLAGGRLARALGMADERTLRPAPALAALQRIRTELEAVARWNDPRGIYMHCLCGED